MKIFRALYPWLNSGQRVGHGDTTDESSGLSMAFRRDRPPYSLEIHQWRPTDNDPCSTSETLKVTNGCKAPCITYYNFPVASR